MRTYRNARRSRSRTPHHKRHREEPPKEKPIIDPMKKLTNAFNEVEVNKEWLV